ncbi:MAG TPA: acyl-CoA dehydrogenase family protein, partial [Jiangellaceae bacterium]|nr:acyl-CoA dehydrogenase family protein [Jiangellaceae bacterium]
MDQRTTQRKPGGRTRNRTSSLNCLNQIDRFRPAETRVHAVRAPDGTWLVSGRKTWISRLVEAAVFVVFFRNPNGRLAAAAIDATAPGLRRTVIPPTGLAGWTWGILDLDAVPLTPTDVLDGDGMLLLRDHFAHYRPLA